MSIHREPAAQAGGIALLERAVNYTLGSAHRVTPDALARPTPCRDWDLRTLLWHLNDSLLALTEAVDLGRVEVDPTASGDATDPVATLRTLCARLLGAWAGSGGQRLVSIGGNPLTTSIISSTGAIEVAVHGWDVAKACGRHHPIPRSLAEEMLDLCPLLVVDRDRPGRFAAPVAVSDLATASDRLVAYLGRQPHDATAGQSA
jgi:uncharacterized protein (TIGR03086 family)